MNPVAETEEFKKLASELYKKNLDLFNANRTLTILQKLYQIMASVLTMEEMAQQFLDVIVTDMSFLSGMVIVKYPNEEFLRPIVITRSQANLDILSSLNINLADIKLGLNDEINIADDVFKTRERKSTNTLRNVFSFIKDEAKINNVETVMGIKSTVAYPIIFGAETLGVFLVSMGVEEDKLTQTDNEILDRVAIVFGIAMDRLMLYQNLQTANERLKFLDSQKDEFLNIASHELRAPMTAVKGYVSMTQNGDGGEIPVSAQELLSEAATEADRMIRLVNNMLNVARIEEGRMVFQEGEVNLAEVVERVFNEFKFEAKNKALQYELAPITGVSDHVVVDVDRIHEVVSNLVNNAIKYTDSGKVNVKVFNPSPEVVRFEVADTGLGMSPDELPKLFQKFYRAESYIGKKVGTGLGLYISKLLVEKFGGKIGVNSEKGKGSLFWFELPVKV